MDENEITQRLRDAGRQQVPGEVRSTHLSQMGAATPVVERTKRFGRLAVAAAAFAGFAVGSTGFAMAGALPEPAQQVAHDVLSVVKVNVENPKNRGQCVSEASRDPALDEAGKKAAKDACPKGKPEGVGKGKPDGNGKGKGRPDHAGTPGGPNDAPHDDDPCKGPPPWAGKAGKAMSDADKQAFKDARAACPADDDAAEDAAEAAEDQREREAEAAEEQQEQVPVAPPADPGADQRSEGQGAPPEQTPAAPPAEDPPSAQGGQTPPPVEVPAPDDDGTDTPAG